MTLLVVFVGCLFAFAFVVALTYTYLVHRAMPALKKRFMHDPQIVAAFGAGVRDGAERDVFGLLRELADGLTQEQVAALASVLTMQQQKTFIELMTMAYPRESKERKERT